MARDEVDCYVLGVNCYVKNPYTGEYDDESDVTEAVWDAIGEMIEEPVKSSWNLTAFSAKGISVFTYVDRTTQYKLWLEEVVGAPPKILTTYHPTAEKVITRDGEGIVELSIGRGGNQRSWTNNTGRMVILTVRTMDPRPMFYGGPYWEAPGSSAMGNDSSVITPENCRDGDMYTVVLQPGESIHFIGAGDVEKNGAMSMWSVNYGEAHTRTA
jgi:hypothetical protein